MSGQRLLAASGQIPMAAHTELAALRSPDLAPSGGRAVRPPAWKAYACEAQGSPPTCRF